MSSANVLNYTISLPEALDAVSNIQGAGLAHAVIYSVIDSHMDDNIDWLAVGQADWGIFKINKMTATKAILQLREAGLIRRTEAEPKVLGRAGKLFLYSTKSSSVGFPDYSQSGGNIAVMPEPPLREVKPTDNGVDLVNDETDENGNTHPF